MTLTPGIVLNNRYRLVKLLAQGGFGTVYRAWDLNLKIACALKENLRITPDAQRQFDREAAMLASLQHPNLPRVTDHFSIPGQGEYLVMDFVEGEDLQQILDRTGAPVPEHQALAWIDQVCDALTYLHTHTPPIIHRDVKPANIKITPQGRAILVDFGIAKAYTPNAKTTQGARAVTPGYSPPEQYGQGSTDARSDIYALGATLYTILTVQEPVESIQRNLGTSLVAPRQVNPGISPHIEAAMLRALNILPDHRFQNIIEFKHAIMGMEWQSALLTTNHAQRVSSSRVQSTTFVSPIPNPGRTIHIWQLAVLGCFGIILLIAVIALFGQLPGQGLSNVSTTEVADLTVQVLEMAQDRATIANAVQQTAQAQDVIATATQQTAQAFNFAATQTAFEVIQTQQAQQRDAELTTVALQWTETQQSANESQQGIRETQQKIQETSIAFSNTQTAEAIHAEALPPDQVVSMYWEAVNNADYGVAWSILSPGFKEKWHSNDYFDYVNGYNSMNVCSITASDTTLVTQNNSEAVVTAHMTYKAGKSCKVSEYDFQFEMVFDPTQNMWLINIVTKR